MGQNITPPAGPASVSKILSASKNIHQQAKSDQLLLQKLENSLHYSYNGKNPAKTNCLMKGAFVTLRNPEPRVPEEED